MAAHNSSPGSHSRESEALATVLCATINTFLHWKWWVTKLGSSFLRYGS